jgi:hypothetical protein
MTKKTEKTLIIAIVVIAVLILVYMMYERSRASKYRATLLALLPNDAKFAKMINALTQKQVIALGKWNASGRPSTWTSDKVLAPVLNNFKNNGNYFF